MSDDPDVVIVGADGTEHVFPPGFDPKKAAAIVRGSGSGEGPALTRPVLGSSVGERSDATSGVDRLNQSLQGLAHPATGADMAALMIPGGGGGVVDRALEAAKKLPLARMGMGAASGAYGAATAPDNATPLGTLGRVAKYAAAGVMAPTALKFLPAAGRDAVEQLATSASEWNSPLTVAGREARAHAAVGRLVMRGADMYQMPRVESVVDRAQKAPQVLGDALPVGTGDIRIGQASPKGMPSGPLRDRYPNGLPIGGDTPPAAVAAPEAAQVAASTPPPMTSGTLRPVASHTPTSPELQQPRVDIGAEKVGRSIGLTKEQVRQQTAPILDEQPGDASPIFPEKVLQSIVDKLRELPRGGPERDAYVQAATSGKARAQVENARRVLEHVGMVIPAAAAVSPSIRDMLLQQMRAGVTDQD